MLYLTEARRLPTERRLRLTWSDGRTSELDYDTLRGYCPCAMCQGHFASELRFHPPPSPVDLTSIAPVGNYGLSLVFSDGHGTGIYRYELLLEISRLVPVAEERAGQPQGGDFFHGQPANAKP